MGARERAAEAGAARARAILGELSREIRDARLGRGLSQARVGSAVGLSAAQVSRIERGLVSAVTLDQVARILAVVGLELGARAYPGGEPIRDRAHRALLERLRARLHPSLRWRTEVPLPLPGDRRAWDATIEARDWRAGTEAETRPRDLQAAERRIALKQRDGDMPLVILLLLLDSEHNRRLVRESANLLAGRFPASGRRTLELLSVGARPEASSVVLL